MGLFRRNRIEHDAQGERKVAETELEANEASRGGVYPVSYTHLCLGG